MTRPSTHSRGLVAELAFALALVATPAAAQNLDDARYQKARKLSDEGLRYYDLAQYDRAIKTFQEAYALAPIPGLLFNLAQAFRLKGDCAQALSHYEQYLEKQPHAFNRAQVEHYEAEMRECVAKAPPTPPPPPAVVAAPPAPPPPVEHRENGSGRRTLGLVLTGVGVAAAGAATYFALSARDNRDELAELCQTGCEWSDPRLRAIDSDGHTNQQLSIVLYGVGGAMVVTGGILYYLGWRADRGVPTMAASPAGWMVGWSATF